MSDPIPPKPQVLESTPSLKGVIKKLSKLFVWLPHFPTLYPKSKSRRSLQKGDPLYGRAGAGGCVLGAAVGLVVGSSVGIAIGTSVSDAALPPEGLPVGLPIATAGGLARFSVGRDVARTAGV